MTNLERTGGSKPLEKMAWVCVLADQSRLTCCAVHTAHPYTRMFVLMSREFAWT